MTDFASLVLAVDSSQVPKGTAALDGLAAAGARAEAATVGFGGGAKTAAVQAAAMAAAAQASARAAVGQAAGFNAVTTAVHGNTIAMRETLVVGRELASGNLTRLPGSLSILAQQFAISGKSAGGFASQILSAFGIVKRVSTDTALAEEAAAAAGAAASVRAAAERAGANIAAADTELALAEASMRVAKTSEAEAAAQILLAKAHQSVAAAAIEAEVAENALASAETRAGAAGQAAAATTVTRLGPIGVALIGVAAAAGTAVLAFKTFQDQVRDSGTLDKFANSLGLSKKEMRELRQEVGGLSSKEMQDLDNRARAFEITWGDVFHGIAKTASDALDLSQAWQKFKADAADAFGSAIRSAVTAASYIQAFWSASIARFNQQAEGLGAMIGNAYRGFGNAPKEDSAKSFWDDVGAKAAEAQKQISKNLETIRGNIIGAAEKRIKDTADSIIEDRTAKKAKKANDHGLAEALAELDAQIKGQNALAAAYQVSDAAAIKAEALQKAEEQAIRHKGEVGIFYEKELALAIATRAAEGAKTIADLRFEADSRAAVNSQIEQGLIPASQASQALELESKLRPLTAAASVAEGDAKTRLVDIIRNLTNAYASNNAEIAKEAALREIASKTDDTDKLKLEISLVAASNKVRAEQLALLQAEQFVKNNNVTDPKAVADVKQAYLDAADATVGLQEAQDNYNASLTKTLDMLTLIAEQTSIVGQALSNAFGQAGSGVSSILTSLANLEVQQAQIAHDAEEARKKAGNDAIQLANIDAQAAQKSKNAQLQAIGGVLEGLKSLFKEHSAGYNAMVAAEKAFAIIQAINTIKNIAAGASKMFAELGPFAFPAVAAMLAVMAGLGFSGGSSTQTAPTIPTSGTGTVLGDSTAVSNSISDSLGIMAKNSTKGLDYSLDMVRSLRSIESGIGALAANVARQLSLTGGFFDTTGKLGTSGGGSGLLTSLLSPILSLFGLGGSTKTKSLYDEGIKINPASIAEILTKGITGVTYQVIETVKKSSGFLGIGGGTSTSYKTTTGALDSDFAKQAQLVIGDLYKSVVDAAKVLGLDVADMLKTFKVNIGQISLKDLKGDDITKALEGVFSKVADQMAGFAVKGLEQYQKAGEGLFETLMRLAKDYLTVDTALKSIGLTFGSVGAESVAARESLIDLMGGLDKFTDQINFYYEHFLTAAEQTSFLQSQIDAQFAKLGVAEPQSIDAFKALVKSLDLTTDAGQAMFASLMEIAPAFYEVSNAAAEANKKLIQGFQATIDQFTKFADSLKKYRDTLFQTDAAQGNAYAALKAKFAATAALAATGDATALGNLQGAGQDFLSTARNNASSLQQYLRDVAEVARGVDQGIFAAETTADYAQLQLDALQNATTILGTIADNTAATASALTQVIPTPAAAAAQAPAQSSSKQTAEIFNSSFTAILTGIAQNTGATYQLLRRFDRGDSLAISNDADTPLTVSDSGVSLA